VLGALKKARMAFFNILLARQAAKRHIRHRCIGDAEAPAACTGLFREQASP
jgi:hypothetical protein